MGVTEYKLRHGLRPLEKGRRCDRTDAVATEPTMETNHEPEKASTGSTDDETTRDAGGTYDYVDGGRGTGSLGLDRRLSASFNRSDATGSVLGVHDARTGISVELDLELEDGRIGALVDVDAEAAEALADALYRAADVERTRAGEGIPAAVDAPLGEGDDE
jgi:hypothetical protein